MLRRFAIATTALVSLAVPGTGWSELDPAARALEPGRALIDDLGDRARQADASEYAWRIHHAGARWREHYKGLSQADRDALAATYATPRPPSAAHLPGMTANDITFLDSLGIRFRVTADPQTDYDGSTWDEYTIEVYASSTALRRAVTASDIVASAADFQLHLGTWNVGSDLRVGLRRQLPRDVEYSGPKVFLERNPCPAPEWGSGVVTRRTVQPDGTVTVEEKGRRCQPPRTRTRPKRMDCVNGVEGGIHIRETTITERDPNDPYGSRDRVTRTILGDICDLDGPGITTTVPQSRVLVVNEELACPAGSTGDDGRHRIYLLTLTAAVQGSLTGPRWVGNDVTGRRLEIDHDPGSCKWDQCTRPAETRSIQIAGVPADMATVTWNIADGGACSYWENSDDNGFSSGVDLDGDGDIDISLTEANERAADPNSGFTYTDDQVITVRDDDRTHNDFAEDNNDDETSDHGGCFLTTAVVAMRGEADDGPTLTALRNFRDGWLAETEEGRAMIAEYYALAPGIVAAIPEGHAEWAWIGKQVDAARDAIVAGMNDQALAVYAGMVQYLEKRWL